MHARTQDDVRKVGKGVLRFRASPWLDNLVATGGQENDLHVWDLAGSDKTVPLFQARNVKPTKLDLRVPITINDIQFANAEGNRLVTATAYHQVCIRIHPRAHPQNRPMLTRAYRGRECRSVCTTPRQDGGPSWTLASANSRSSPS